MRALPVPRTAIPATRIDVLFVRHFSAVIGKLRFQHVWSRYLYD
jgi:hypothetical protein